MLSPLILAVDVVAAPATAHGGATTVKDMAPTIYALAIDNALNLVTAIIILLVGWTVAIWVRRWIRGAFLHMHVLDASLGPILASLARYAILALTVMAVLGRFGVQLTSLIAIIGAAGIAIGLALQGTLSNVASGLMLLLLRPFRSGDMIALLDDPQTRGRVTEIGLFRTTIAAVDNRILSLPNSDVFGGTIVNYSEEPRYRIDITVPVDHVNDLAKIRGAFLEVVEKNDRILKDPAPTVGVSELGDYYATMLIRFWVPYVLRNPVSWELREALHDRMRAEHIAFPTPRQAAVQRNESDLDAALTGVIVAPKDQNTPMPAPLSRVRPAE